MIDKIGGINPLNNVQNLRKADNAAKVSKSSDSIEISKEAVEMAEAYYLEKVAAETPDVRADKIAEVRAKLQDPNYLNNAVFNSAADSFLTSLGI